MMTRNGRLVDFVDRILIYILQLFTRAYELFLSMKRRIHRPTHPQSGFDSGGSGAEAPFACPKRALYQAACPPS